MSSYLVTLGKIDIHEQRPKVRQSLCVVTSKTLLALRETGVSTVVALDRRKRANDCGASFKTRIYAKNVSFSDVACNKRHAPRVPFDVGNGQFKLCADPIGRYRDIRARIETGSRRVPSARNSVAAGEVRKTTTALLSTSMDSVCASQIRWRSDSPFLEILIYTQIYSP